MMLGLLVLNFVALSAAQLVIFPDQYEPSPTMLTGQIDSGQNSFQNSSEYWSMRVNNLISRGIAKFALDMDNAIARTRNGTSDPHQNVIFSPLSLAGTMTMVLLGSSGKTFEEVSHILGFEVEVDISRHSEVVHQIFGLLLSSVGNRVRMSGPRVDYASGIFVQDGFPIRPEFQTISEYVYKSQVQNLDFATRPAEAQRRVNAWVAEKTSGKITSILSQTPRIDTKVILASALYFNGEWNQHFLSSATKRRPFYVEPGQSVEVDMMYNGGEFPFYEDTALGAKIVALPYKDFEISMYVILPKAEGETALRDMESRLTADMLNDLIRNLRNQTCIVGLPRMKLSSTLELRDAFETLGLHSLFNPRTADLSLLSPGYGATVSSPVTPPPGLRPLQNPPAALSAPIAASKVAPAAPVSASAAPSQIPQTVPGRGYRGPVLPTRYDQDDEVLIFSRFNNENESRASVNRTVPIGHVRYEDGDYAVERWPRGFHIQKLRRGSTTGGRGMRRRRAARRGKRDEQRPIDRAFLDFLGRQNFLTFGLDDIRNSGQTRNPGLYADQVYHKTVMDVTETGTEAAAATAVSLNRDGSQKRMIVNRPFLFFIRHDASKLILFWGTVNTPTPNYTS